MEGESTERHRTQRYHLGLSEHLHWDWQSITEKHLYVLGTHLYSIAMHCWPLPKSGLTLFLHLALMQAEAGHTHPRKKIAMESFAALVNVF